MIGRNNENTEDNSNRFRSNHRDDNNDDAIHAESTKNK